MNYAKWNVSNLVENNRNFVDLAIPVFSGEERVLGKNDDLAKAKLLFCGKNVKGDSAEFIDSSVRGDAIVNCRDIGKDWRYGIIFGRTYGVSFIVKADSKYGEKLINCKAEKEDSCYFEDKVLSGESWLEKLINIAGERERVTKHKWNGIWRELERGSIQEGFVLGEIFDVEGFVKSRDKGVWKQDGVYYDNCHSTDVEIGRCRLGVIDVASYTLKKDGKGPIWSNKFTPKLTWKRVKKEQQTSSLETSS